MVRYKQGLRVATCLFEAAAWHRAVRIVCRCGHSASFNPHGLWWHFHSLSLSDELSAVGLKFWCRECARRVGRRVRPQRVELVDESDADVRLALPPEREWKREVNRFRS